MLIISLENEKVKKMVKLKEKKYRDSYQEFIVEGEHLIIEANRSGLLEEVYLEEGREFSISVPITYVTKEVLAKISTLDTPSYIIGICKRKEQIAPCGTHLLLLDRIQDPGNLGTIIRSSLAFGVDTIILSEDSVDFYHTKVIRATQGMGFHINIINRNLKEVIEECKKKGIPVYGTKVEGGEDIRNLKETDKEKYALVMGNEGQGVRSEILALCDRYLSITMNEKVESLNVSIATSILLYEFARR